MAAYDVYFEYRSEQSSRLRMYKMLFCILFVSNCMLTIQMTMKTNDMLDEIVFWQFIYLFSLIAASIGVYSLAPAYLTPSIYLLIPSFLCPFFFFIYLTSAFNYCFFRENYYLVNDTQTVLIIPLSDECFLEWPYTFDYRASWVLLVYAIFKLVELLVLLRLRSAIALDRECIDAEMRYRAGQNKPTDETDDELVVFEKMAPPPYAARVGARPSVRDVTAPAIA